MRNKFAAFAAVLALSCPAFATLTTTTNSATYTGNGSTTAFTVPFKFLANTDLVVTVAGAVKALTTDYSVKGAGNATGTVTFTSAPAGGAAVVITRLVPLTQNSTVRQTLPFPAGATIDTALDKLTMGLQQNAAKDAAQDQAIIAAINPTPVTVNSNSLILGTGTTTSRTLAARAVDTVNVKDFGATGNGTTDDTAAIQAAITATNATPAQLYFPAGTYSVSNLTHGTAPWIGQPRQTIIRARNSGDAGYLVASGQWLAAGATTASNPWNRVQGIDFDSAGFKTFTIVLRTYFTKIENCRIKGATDTDLLISSDARDATLLASTMVNDEIIGNWIGVDGSTASYGLRVIDTNGKVTDDHLLNNYLSGASVSNLSLPTSAGWLISGNHFYGATRSAEIYKPNIGTRIIDNYFEGEVSFGSPNMTATDASTIGPGNFFSGAVWADFNNASNTIVSVGNTYHANAELRHAFLSSAKVLVSQDDVFRKTQPFTFYNTLHALSNSSAGRFRVNSFVAGVRVAAYFDGPSSTTAGIMHLPANPWGTIGTMASFDGDGAGVVQVSIVNRRGGTGASGAVSSVQSARLSFQHDDLTERGYVESLANSGPAWSLNLGTNGQEVLRLLSSGEVLLSHPLTFATLGAPSNGTIAFCSDCTVANPCAGGGTGALAKRLNGVWVCN